MTDLRAGTWGGHPMYGCPHCAFTSLDETEVITHAAAHQPPASPSGLVDARGAPLPAPPPDASPDADHDEPVVLTEPAPPVGADIEENPDE